MNKLFISGALIFSLLGGVMLYTLPQTEVWMKMAYWMPNVGALLMLASGYYRNTALIVLCTIAIRMLPADAVWMAIPLLLLVISQQSRA